MAPSITSRDAQAAPSKGWSWSRILQPWGGKPQVKVANLGVANKYYYNHELQHWVDEGGQPIQTNSKSTTYEPLPHLPCMSSTDSSSSTSSSGSEGDLSYFTPGPFISSPEKQHATVPPPSTSRCPAYKGCGSHWYPLTNSSNHGGNTRQHAASVQVECTSSSPPTSQRSGAPSLRMRSALASTTKIERQRLVSSDASPFTTKDAWTLHAAPKSSSAESAWVSNTLGLETPESEVAEYSCYEVERHWPRSTVPEAGMFDWRANVHLDSLADQAVDECLRLSTEWTTDDEGRTSQVGGCGGEGQLDGRNDSLQGPSLQADLSRQMLHLDHIVEQLHAILGSLSTAPDAASICSAISVLTQQLTELEARLNLRPHLTPQPSESCEANLAHPLSHVHQGPTSDSLVSSFDEVGGQVAVSRAPSSLHAPSTPHRRGHTAQHQMAVAAPPGCTQKGSRGAWCLDPPGSPSLAPMPSAATEEFFELDVSEGCHQGDSSGGEVDGGYASLATSRSLPPSASTNLGGGFAADEDSVCDGEGSALEWETDDEGHGWGEEVGSNDGDAGFMGQGAFVWGGGDKWLRLSWSEYEDLLVAIGVAGQQVERLRGELQRRGMQAQEVDDILEEIERRKVLGLA